MKTLVISSKGKIQEVSNGYKKKNGNIVWTHLTSDEADMHSFLMQDLSITQEEEEDLMEDQRPRLSNFKGYTVIVIGMPIKKILEDIKDPDEGTLQITFIIKRKSIISVSDQRSKLIDEVMKRVRRSKKRISVTSLLSLIMAPLIENVVDTMEVMEKNVDKMQKEIIAGNNLDSVIQRVSDLKENIFFASKQLRADLEVVREIQYGKSDYLIPPEFHEHIEDRLLYALDVVDTARESLNGLNNLYMAAISNRMNEHMYRLTIIGALLIVPTIIAGFWGMNVDLPLQNFWLIVIISIVLALLLALWVWLARR